MRLINDYNVHFHIPENVDYWNRENNTTKCKEKALVTNSAIARLKIFISFLKIYENARDLWKDSKPQIVKVSPTLGIS